MKEHTSEDQERQVVEAMDEYIQAQFENEETKWRIEVGLRYRDYLEDCGDDEVPMSLSSFREDLEESMIAQAELRDEIRLWEGGV